MHYFLYIFRALKTINIRNEAEKQNIWVAFLNLENEYGNPREVCSKYGTLFRISPLMHENYTQIIMETSNTSELFQQSVMKVFNRAIQQCDPLKLHLELLGLYERTDQNQLADELLQKMMKKFKDSTEVYVFSFNKLAYICYNNSIP